MAAIAAAGVVVFALVVNRHYPIERWMFLRYARAVAFAGVFGGSCLVAGHAVVVRLLKRTLPLEEHVSIAFAVGVLAFFLTTFVAGILGLYGTAFFLLCPALLIALGGPDFLRTMGRVARHGHRTSLRITPGHGAALAMGVLAIAWLWLGVMTPQNASYDARWYHLPIAQHYVAEGRISAFSEGWVPGALPQLASLLWTWALCMPGALFDRVITAAHVELVIFLFTLVGVSALVKRALGRRVPGAWVSLFLFPGIFCYDSGLVLGADHVAAVFAAPILLLSLRYWNGAERGHALLLAAATAGAVCTKYTALNLVPVPLSVVAVRAYRDRALTPALTFVGAALALTSPHWLKNWAFYGDPVFPVLRHWLPAHPWAAAAEAPHRTWFTLKAPPANLSGIVDMVKTFATFSFVPHDFPQYHRDVPVFGSLFTLTTPFLFVIRKQRVTLVFVAAYLGLAAWFWIHQYDRYLQTLVPWMAAGTCAVLIVVWGEGGWARVGVAALVGLQLVWGGDVPFLRSHRTATALPPKVVIDLLGMGFERDFDRRFESYPDWEAMGRALPRGAKVLVHEEELHFGLGVATALDYSGDQGTFYWGEPDTASPRAVWTALRAHGITHVLWADRLDHGTDTPAAALVFFDLVTHHVKRLGTFGGFALGELGTEPPPEGRVGGDVAYFPCETGFPFAPFTPGLYSLAAMARAPGDTRGVAPAALGVGLEQAIDRARFLVLDPRCNGALSEGTRDAFELLAARGTAMILMRKEPR